MNPLSIFTRMMLLIVLLLTPIVGLYTYSYAVSVRVIGDELVTARDRQLARFREQIDDQLQRLSLNAIILLSDVTVRDFAYTRSQLQPFEQHRLKRTLLEKMMLQSVSTGWSSGMTLYASGSDDYITTQSRVQPRGEAGRAATRTGEWIYRTTESSVSEKAANEAELVLYSVYPAAARGNPSSAMLVLETSFQLRPLIDLLDRHNAEGRGGPFLYSETEGVIVGTGADMQLIQRLIKQLNTDEESREGSWTAMLGDDRYLVSVQLSRQLDWQFVDYVPLEDLLAPVESSRNWFYASTALLLLLSVLACYLLYRHVQVPIRELTRGVTRLRSGEYGYRLASEPGHDFRALFAAYNEMAERIQTLIEHVYAEQIHTREAKLKQLQSQISPHFLYNCLFFIKNMSRLGRHAAVEAMALNLGAYYRYTTRLESSDGTIGEELEFLRNYLSIQQLRMNRITYEIEMPADMLQLRVPRLLLQPLVENALMHGIEPREADGRIRLSGERSGRRVCVRVDDDGAGMSDEQLARLRRQISAPLQAGTGYALWNIHHRLLYRYGEGSDLEIGHSPLGGLRVVLIWHIKDEDWA